MHAGVPLGADIWPSKNDPSEWLFFFDESGDGKLYRTDPTWEVFALCGVAVRRDYYFSKLVPTWRDFIAGSFGRPDVVLHTSKIRAKRGAFARLNDPDENSRFITRFNALYSSLHFTVIAVVVLKPAYRVALAAPGETDVYARSVNSVLWMLVRFLRRNGGRCNLIGEPRRDAENRFLQRAYQRAHSTGLYDVEPNELQALLPPAISFRPKVLNDPGVQLADLSAYPLARRAYKWPDAYPAYEHVYRKLYSGGHPAEKAYGYRIVPEPPAGFRFTPP